MHTHTVHTGSLIHKNEKKEGRVNSFYQEKKSPSLEREPSLIHSLSIALQQHNPHSFSTRHVKDCTITSDPVGLVGEKSKSQFRMTHQKEDQIRRTSLILSIIVHSCLQLLQT